MSEVPFYRTRMGVKFFESDVPRLIEVLERLTVAVEKLADLGEEESEGGSDDG